MRAPHGAELLPGGGPQGREALAVEVRDVRFREGAPVGDQEQRLGAEVLRKQVAPSGDGGVAVMIAVGDVAEERQRAEPVHETAHPGLQELGVRGRMPEGDPGRGIRGGRAGRRRWRRLRGALEDEVRGVVMQILQVQAVGPANVQGHAGQDGAALGEEGIQGAAEAVVIELSGGDLAEQVRAAVLSPGGDVDQGHGVTQAGSEEELQDGGVGELGLGVGGQVLLQDGAQLQAFQEGPEDGQGSHAQGRVGRGHSIAGAAHGQT